MTPNMMNKKINKMEWVHHLLETHWMKAQLSWAGLQSIGHPLNEKSAQSNGWNPQLSWCTVCLKPMGWKTTIKWVHHGFQWMRPIGRNPQLSGCTINSKHVGWRPQSSGCTTVSNGWNPQLSGCPPSLGNLLDEDHNWVGAPGSAMDETYWMKYTTEWVCSIYRKPFGWRPMNPLNGCAPWFSKWMRPIGWKPKPSYQDSKPQNWQYDTALFQRMRDNKNSTRLVVLLYQNYE